MCQIKSSLHSCQQQHGVSLWGPNRSSVRAWRLVEVARTSTSNHRSLWLLFICRKVWRAAEQREVTLCSCWFSTWRKTSHPPSTLCFSAAVWTFNWVQFFFLRLHALSRQGPKCVRACVCLERRPRLFQIAVSCQHSCFLISLWSLSATL